MMGPCTGVPSECHKQNFSEFQRKQTRICLARKVDAMGKVGLVS